MKIKEKLRRRLNLLAVKIDNEKLVITGLKTLERHLLQSCVLTKPFSQYNTRIDNSDVKVRRKRIFVKGIIAFEFFCNMRWLALSTLKNKHFWRMMGKLNQCLVAIY